MTKAKMTEEERWLAYEDPPNLLISLNRDGLERKERLFAVACCRRIWPLLADARSRTAVEVAERFADDQASIEELEAANQGALAVWLDSQGGNYAARACEQVSKYVGAYDVSISAANAVSKQVRQQDDRTDTFGVEQAEQSRLLRDIFGNPFRPVAFSPEWRTGTALAIARQMYESRDFFAMPILADALENAGCDSEDILNHCRGPGSHVRGCWVVDLVLGKE